MTAHKPQANATAVVVPIPSAFAVAVAVPTCHLKTIGKRSAELVSDANILRLSLLGSGVRTLTQSDVCHGPAKGKPSSRERHRKKSGARAEKVRQLLADFPIPMKSQETKTRIGVIDAAG